MNHIREAIMWRVQEEAVKENQSLWIGSAANEHSSEHAPPSLDRLHSFGNSCCECSQLKASGRRILMEVAV